MEIELLEIRDFLSAHHPFDQLPQQALNQMPEKLQIRYFRRGATIPDVGSIDDYLYLVRSGAVEIHGLQDELLARLGEGDLFGYRASHMEGHEKFTGIALEDSLVYQLPATDVDVFCREHPQFSYFFEPAGGDRLRDAISNTGEDGSTQLGLMATQIGEMISRLPITMPPFATIQQTAAVMSDERVSSILITEADETLTGIVTDRDLRRRVVAKGLDTSLPISEIMTPAPYTLDAGDYAFDAMLQMARSNIHHLPILRNGKIAGMLTATDFAQRHTTSAVYLVSSIYKQSEISGLASISAKLPQLLLNLAAADATANSIGHVITAVVDAITTRLLQLAEEQFGPPPVPYAWIAAGSQARSEQTAKSDQDNCLVLDDTYDPSEHGEYFKQLSQLVCDGLNACGYVYCPGEMMATTDKWRQPLKTWKRYFDGWVDQPEPKALMLTCVFFDLRCIAGEKSLFQDLREYLLDKTRGNQIFLAYMAGNALSHKPPLGFFRNFVLISGGDHDHTFDLKHTGIVPIVDLARVYALAAGSHAINTQDRLKEVASGGEVSQGGAHDLRDALEFVSSLRIKHQATQIRAGEAPDNYMSPDDLSHFERSHLKDAFSVVRTMQNVLSQRYLR
ncbi:putative nucleotidyltransferase substrate binding domain-containing protein [Sedimenticola selenatireducens]|uniref:Cyclic nucleotide-binding/CBS domain-containing protein n=1 Tax=Sedimenticola selenatireducens TaxID=191960 RepID=A0A557S551_9GAMM|nr:putative nucleotidyltransferase substrate binding domain-containing protein [Sedimenticola selenatireducens]TVO72525.1 cyclic nucleotide-binding/CBS domain-containing protein [Sedimenticola selenatireducens]TVT64780.1 MAG: cyclic nucleotide-binding/CBS domain-containing protein [Sedimenticola selenatireducens]